MPPWVGMKGAAVLGEPGGPKHRRTKSEERREAWESSAAGAFVVFSVVIGTHFE